MAELPARKIVLLQKRASDFEVSLFQQRLASTCEDDPQISGLSRYVQSHTLLQGYRKGELLVDAVEEFTFATPSIADVFMQSPAFADICARRAALVDHERTFTMEVDVHCVKDGPVPPSAVKNIEFVNRRPTIALEEFRRYWLHIHGPLGATIPTILRYEQNHLAPPAYDDMNAPQFDGLAITWFESTASMRAGAASQEYAETRIDESNFLPDGHLPIIITREAVEK